MTELTKLVLDTLNRELTCREPDCHEIGAIAKQVGAELFWGASRWAFVFKEQKVVYKFPRFENTHVDYCAQELANYELAKQYRVERCLLSIELVGTVKCGFGVYLQPMFTTSQENLPYNLYQRWQNSINFSRYGHEPFRKCRNALYYEPNRFWLARAMQIYGKAFMRSFAEWTNKVKLNDLHDANIGYLGKQPIIFDYAGWNNQSDSSYSSWSSPDSIFS